MRGLFVIVVLAVAAPAAADPPEARVLTAPTSWVLPAGAVTTTVAIDHKGDGAWSVGYGLGGLATIELGSDSEIRTCTACDDGGEGRRFSRASFRMGARQDAWFRGMPALALGLKNTFGDGSGAFVRPRVTEAYAVASRALGPVRLHAGVQAMTAAFGDVESDPVLRPVGGFELAPRAYPRSTFIGDVGWTTRLEAAEGQPGRVAHELMGGFGARYRFARWASIELGVRVPGEEGLAGSRVMIRVHGVWRTAKRDEP